ncbi:KilA-N domain-containing protein [uncultured Treponema sp.]|uniref:KilA-N domain-containing protein n=1 Tax=uncultured Treponema sp. TaxID=162155 RepID=UPI0025E8F54C|nr:KilA-N domain-containing protein [uncultured Treponema sp.]
MQKVNVKDTSVSVIKYDETDFISLTDIAKFKSEEPNAVIANWLRNRNTIEYLGIWETLYNSDFNPLEFEGVKKEAGLKAFTNYASMNQLICLSNMENLNAVFINDGIPQSERLEKLNKIAIQQMKVLENIEDRKLLTDNSGADK